MQNAAAFARTVDGALASHSKGAVKIAETAGARHTAQGEGRGADGEGDPPSREVAGLRPRELSVCRLAAAGLSNKAIAGRLQLSDATVKVHMKGAMRSLGVRSRTALISVFGIVGAVKEVPPVTLDALERRILDVLATGARNRDIADATGLSEALVKSKVRALCDRTRNRNRTLLAAWHLATTGHPVSDDPVALDVVWDYGMLERLREMVSQGRPMGAIGNALHISDRDLTDGVAMLMSAAPAPHPSAS